MGKFKKRKYDSPDGSFLKNDDVSKKLKADVLSYENRLRIDWHEVKVILDATVVEKYLNNRKFNATISPSHCDKILVQKIPRLNQDVFSEKNNVMVKLEIPEDIGVDDNLLPTENLVFAGAPFKQEDFISVLDSSDNDTFYDRDFIKPSRQNFECQGNDDLTVEAALKKEVVESECCYEETSIHQEFKDTLKNEELFVGEEFKHEEAIPSYENENVESIDRENNAQTIKKKTRSSRKRKKCFSCDDCSHGLEKKSRDVSHNKVVTPKLPVQDAKTHESQAPSKPTNPESSLRVEERKTNKESPRNNSPGISETRKIKYKVRHCDHCDYKGRRYILIKHLRNKHPYLFPNDWICCSNCDMEFKSWKEMQKHRRVCLLFFICKFCLVNVPSKQAMVRHMKLVHPEKICKKNGEWVIDNMCLNSMTNATETLELTAFGKRYMEIKKYYSEMEFELIKLYCPKCDVTRDKVTNRRAPTCYICKTRFLFQCQKCKDTRTKYLSVWKHLTAKISSCSISENLSISDHEEASNATSQASSNEPNCHDCGICDFKGTTKKQLYEHVLNAHLPGGIISNGYYTCSKCGASFRYGDVRFKKHQELCDIAVRFPCRFCPLTCTNKYHLSYHIATMHFDELDGRDINEFLQEALGFKNMVRELNHRRFNDKLRNETMKTDKDYYHNGIESMLKPVCIKCKVNDPRDLERCADCQASLNFVCLKCDELFSKYSDAWDHATRMCENRSFTLTVGKTLENPMKVDTSTRKKRILYCDHCNFKNASKSILCNHIKYRHSKSQEIHGLFSCPKCYRNFDNSGNLHTHRLRCRAAFDYKCRFCDRTASKFHVIKNHITMTHSKQVRCNDTLDEILQQVIENKTLRPPESEKFDKFGRLIKRTFAENISLTALFCSNCKETVHKNFKSSADTRTCPKCNWELLLHCKVCGRAYSRWGSITNHFQLTDCGKIGTCNEDRRGDEVFVG